MFACFTIVAVFPLAQIENSKCQIVFDTFTSLNGNSNKLSKTV